MSTPTPTDRIVVGYTATKAGRDAVAFASRLAAASGAGLHLVLVLPAQKPGIVPPDAGYERLVREQAAGWLRDGAAEVPDGIAHRAHVRYGESVAAGLVDAADELGASLIVVGAADGGNRGRHRLGTTTTELVHSSDVPVALVPRGARRVPAETGVTRLTAAVGEREGTELLVDQTIRLAAATGVPVRLLSLVALDLPAGLDTGAIRTVGDTHAQDVLAEVRAALPADADVAAVVATGDGIEDAASHLEWEAGEIVLVGSSRLAQPRRLFLGSTAARMLRVVTVPMIVVPRTRSEREGASA
ncbi:universal stress protein [Microbacterium oleivorans]|uniref:Universal stress protein n=1 Tax=Microbacterium oleivorans TaxID=273677 RepID=A0A7D5EVZ5_9MICO|nr:universal stress protein [Microbacterium oleivorans]QLD11186.1 universal stress protein [Microbacterium oleivorans]